MSIRQDLKKASSYLTQALDIISVLPDASLTSLMSEDEAEEIRCQMGSFLDYLEAEI